MLWSARNQFAKKILTSLFSGNIPFLVSMTYGPISHLIDLFGQFALRAAENFHHLNDWLGSDAWLRVNGLKFLCELLDKCIEFGLTMVYVVCMEMDFFKIMIYVSSQA